MRRVESSCQVVLALFCRAIKYAPRNDSASIFYEGVLMTDHVGVCVCKGGDYLFLRFLLRQEHIDRLHKPEKLAIRGQPANGFIIAPDQKHGRKVSRSGDNLFYLQQSVSAFEISARTRKRISLQPIFENGHMRVPPLPPAWINVDPEFAGDMPYVEGERIMAITKHPQDEAVRLSSISVPAVNGATAPLPKPMPDYTVPNTSLMRAMQAELATKLSDARELIGKMQDLTGMQFMLDRNLRLVVKL